MNTIMTRVGRLLAAWPAPAAIGGILAVGVSTLGQAEGALSIGLASAAASLVLARMELRKARQDQADLQAQLENALSHDGFVDVETSLPTLATLRVDWARQLSRYQRHGERFSVAVLDLREEGSAADPAVDLLIAAAERLDALKRTEDTVYRLGPARLGVMLAGSDGRGAQSFIERALPMLQVLEMNGSVEQTRMVVHGHVIDWREGVGAFPEHQLLWDAPAEQATEQLLRRWSGQHQSRHDADIADAA